MKKLLFVSTIAVLSLGSSGCLLAAAGAGAEGGYVLTQKDRTASETLVDQKITSSVKTKLLADADVSGLDINVDTFKGNVTLKGVVSSTHEADKAIALARNTADVKSVESKLVVIK